MLSEIRGNATAATGRDRGTDERRVALIETNRVPARGEYVRDEADGVADEPPAPDPVAVEIWRLTREREQIAGKEWSAWEQLDKWRDRRRQIGRRIAELQRAA